MGLMQVPLNGLTRVQFSSRDDGIQNKTKGDHQMKIKGNITKETQVTAIGVGDWVVLGEKTEPLQVQFARRGAQTTSLNFRWNVRANLSELPEIKKSVAHFVENGFAYTTFSNDTTFKVLV
tara:strand:- start:138 stop:500 length:363 start_codon:yes stop_codon:yes gene_type:complete